MSPLRKASFSQTLRWIQILKSSFTVVNSGSEIYIRLDFGKNTLIGADSILFYLFSGGSQLLICN